MSYQTGVTSTISDLLTTLFTFCETQGFVRGPTWTSLDTGVFPNVVVDQYSLLKDGVYFLFSNPRGSSLIYLNTSTGLNSPNSGYINQQPGSYALNQPVSNLSGPHVGYHFFSDGLAVNVVVEIVTNVFVHFNFGSMQKNGNWQGGQFVTGLFIVGTRGQSLTDPFNYLHVWPFDTSSIGQSNSNFNQNGHVRSPVSGPASPISRAAGGAIVFVTPWAGNAGRPMLEVSPNKTNGRSILIPINFVQSSSGQDGPYYQLGTVANARAVNIANLNPKETVNNDWMVFPVSQKNGPGTTYMNSGNYGLAYKK